MKKESSPSPATPPSQPPYLLPPTLESQLAAIASEIAEPIVLGRDVAFSGAPKVDVKITALPELPPLPVEKLPKTYPRLKRALRTLLGLYGPDAEGPALQTIHLDEDDVLLSWQIVIHSGLGGPEVLQGNFQMSDVLAKHARPEAVQIFETTFGALIMRTAFSKFQTILQRHIDITDAGTGSNSPESRATSVVSSRPPPPRPRGISPTGGA